MGRGCATLEPYQQGEFDALCGLYAIVNAIRKATHGHSQLPNTDWECLFSSLVSKVDEDVGLVRVMSDGLATSKILRLVHHASIVLRDNHDLSIDFDRPLLRKHGLSIVGVIDHVRRCVESKHTAILTRFGGTLGHWTVIDRVGTAYLTLFDSSGYRRVRIDRCRLRTEPSRLTKTEHIVFAGSIIEISSKIS